MVDQLVSARGPKQRVGLALSGGGSRAAAFHRGTLKALHELQLVDQIDVVSTVSGGSVFGAAWMAARNQKQSDTSFLDDIGEELRRGFILRSVRPRLLLSLIPFVPYTRADVLARTFDNIFFRGMTLKELPERPALCVNTSVMNTQQVGRFSRDGFSCHELFYERESASSHVSLPNYRLADAVMASAAFPIGVPPVRLRSAVLPKHVRFNPRNVSRCSVSLTDGGVIENLGAQTLLYGRQHGAWDLIVSDAGVRRKAWQQRSPLNPLKTIGAALLTLPTLTQVMLMMSEKQSAWGRQQVMEDMHTSWFIQELRHPNAQPRSALVAELAHRPYGSRRELLFVRIDQTWKHFIDAIPRYRLVELADGDPHLPQNADCLAREAFLRAAGIDLGKARALYEKLRGDEGVHQCNLVSTNFTGLNSETLERLELHAAWQVHLARAVYGFSSKSARVLQDAASPAYVDVE